MLTEEVEEWLLKINKPEIDRVGEWVERVQIDFSNVDDEGNAKLEYIDYAFLCFSRSIIILFQYSIISSWLKTD